jgi:hypothetical protein
MELNHHEKSPNATTTTMTTLSNETDRNEEALVTLLRNSYELQQKEKQKREKKTTSTRTSPADVDVEERQCPICYWQFPQHMTMDGKREHIEQHFA